MVDRKITGGSWVEVSHNYEIRRDLKKRSHCQIEIDTHYNQIMCQDWMKIAPLRVLSFDIECYNQEGKGFPVAQKNPVIQIAAYVTEHGRSEHVMKGVWVLESCADIAGADVFSFEKESDMLVSFRDFWEKVDPDLISGYNICGFDLPYLLERADTLGVPQFSALSRLRDFQCRIRETQFAGREIKEIDMNGRVQFDMMVVIQ
jgi:DNA polymerase delta subunit 1